MMKALIFDVSGVLTFTNFPKVFENFAKKTNLPEGVIQNYYKETLEDQLLGNRRFHDFFVDMVKYLPDISEDDFKRLWLVTVEELTTINTELLDMIDVWRHKYVCGILTNNTEGRWIFDESIGLHGHFDFVLESFRERMKKPDIRFFLFGLTKVGCKPDEVVYVDDQQRHMDAAKSAGMQGVVFTENDSLTKALDHLGVK